MAPPSSVWFCWKSPSVKRDFLLLTISSAYSYGVALLLLSQLEMTAIVSWCSMSYILAKWALHMLLMWQQISVHFPLQGKCLIYFQIVFHLVTDIFSLNGLGLFFCTLLFNHKMLTTTQLAAVISYYSFPHLHPVAGTFTVCWFMVLSLFLRTKHKLANKDRDTQEFPNFSCFHLDKHTKAPDNLVKGCISDFDTTLLLYFIHTRCI